MPHTTYTIRGFFLKPQDMMETTMHGIHCYLCSSCFHCSFNEINGMFISLHSSSKSMRWKWKGIGCVSKVIFCSKVLFQSTFGCFAVNIPRAHSKSSKCTLIVIRIRKIHLCYNTSKGNSNLSLKMNH